MSITNLIEIALKEEIEKGIAIPDKVPTMDILDNHPSRPYFWVCFEVFKDEITFLNGYKIKKNDLKEEKGDYLIFKRSNVSKITTPIFCNAWSEKPVTCRYSVKPQSETSLSKFKDTTIQIRISLFLEDKPYKEPQKPVTIQVIAFGPP